MSTAMLTTPSSTSTCNACFYGTRYSVRANDVDGKLRFIEKRVQQLRSSTIGWARRGQEGGSKETRRGQQEGDKKGERRGQEGVVKGSIKHRMLIEMTQVRVPWETKSKHRLCACFKMLSSYAFKQC